MATGISVVAYVPLCVYEICLGFFPVIMSAVGTGYQVNCSHGPAIDEMVDMTFLVSKTISESGTGLDVTAASKAAFYLSV